MNQELWALLNLQQADLKIEDIKRKIVNIPEQTAALDAQLKAHDTMVVELKAKLTETQKERRRLEGEVELLRGRLSKYKDQLMAVKKNEEYTAVLKEIANCNAEIDRAEDRILEFMEFCDVVEKEVKVTEADLRIERQEITQQKEELQVRLSVLQAELARLMAEHTAIIERVPAVLMEVYSRLASHGRGLALAEAKDEMCLACHVRLRPQMFNDIRLGNRIITCESCNRLLYWKGEVSAPVK